MPRRTRHALCSSSIRFACRPRRAPSSAARLCVSPDRAARSYSSRLRRERSASSDRRRAPCSACQPALSRILRFRVALRCLLGSGERIAAWTRARAAAARAGPPCRERSTAPSSAQRDRRDRSLLGASSPADDDDQRHPQRRVVGEHAVRLLAVIAEPLAVIAGDATIVFAGRRLTSAASRAGGRPARRRTRPRRRRRCRRPSRGTRPAARRARADRRGGPTAKNGCAARGAPASRAPRRRPRRRGARPRAARTADGSRGTRSS